MTRSCTVCPQPIAIQHNSRSVMVHLYCLYCEIHVTTKTWWLDSLDHFLQHLASSCSILQLVHRQGPKMSPILEPQSSFRHLIACRPMSLKLWLEALEAKVFSAATSNCLSSFHNSVHFTKSGLSPEARHFHRYCTKIYRASHMLANGHFYVLQPLQPHCSMTQ